MPLDRRDRRALLAIGVLGLIAWPAWQAWKAGSTTERLARLVRPGGVLALQEPDSDTMACYPPHPAWDRLRGALEAILPNAVGDMPVAARNAA